MALDRAKCVQMALVHDLAESVIGDIPTFAGVPRGKYLNDSCVHGTNAYKTENSSLNIMGLSI